MTNIQGSSSNLGILPGACVIPDKAGREIHTNAGLSITGQNGTTTINGGRGIKNIHVHQNTDGSWDVNINGEMYHFTSKEAQNLIINSGDGDDNVKVTGHQLYGPKTDFTLNGGNGNDFIIGGNGYERILGGSGNDHLNGKHGDETIWSGVGNDHIHDGWGKGNDKLSPPDLPHLPVAEVELEDPDLTDKHNSLNENDNEDDNITYQDIEGEVFVNGAELTDVLQGQIGDCYFVAALASIAHHNPGCLERMITDNGDGTYTVHFGGDLGSVTVDDDFPVFKSGNPVCAQIGSASEKELWVAIIEKAFAQAHGSYEAIENGKAHEALRELTGQTEFHIGRPGKFLPQFLEFYLAKGQSVTASSPSSNNGKKQQTEFGIVTSHAYVVTDVSKNAEGEWMVTVYNPWGNDRIGPDAITGADDGFIEMTYDQFVANFREVQISQDPIGLAA